MKTTFKAWKSKNGKKTETIEVKGVPVKDTPFIVHRDIDYKGYWTISHIPSGSRIWKYRYKKTCIKVAKELWENYIASPPKRKLLMMETDPDKCIKCFKKSTEPYLREMSHDE